LIDPKEVDYKNSFLTKFLETYDHPEAPTVPKIGGKTPKSSLKKSSTLAPKEAVTVSAEETVISNTS